MRFKPLIAVLATAVMALAATAPAQAKTEDLGDLTDRATYFGNAFSGPVADFTDYYTFTLSGVRNVVGNTRALINIADLFNLNVNSVSLSGGDLSGWLTETSGSDGFSFAQITPGTYTLAVNGSTNGRFGGAYGGVVAGAVPEPETYAMMLLGLGAVAWVARRRKSS